MLGLKKLNIKHDDGILRKTNGFNQGIENSRVLLGGEIRTRMTYMKLNVNTKQYFG
jgi:hypothetical protein